jgi:hypothetical protein
LETGCCVLFQGIILAFIKRHSGTLRKPQSRITGNLAKTGTVYARHYHDTTIPQYYPAEKGGDKIFQSIIINKMTNNAYWGKSVFDTKRENLNINKNKDRR